MSDEHGKILTGREAPSLTETLAGLLEGATQARLAVGYLFVEGLGPLMPRLSKLDSVSLLIGNVVNRLTDEQIREDQASRPTAAIGGETGGFATAMREERDRVASLTALNFRRTIESLPKTDANQSLIVSLAGMIAAKRLQVRLYTQARLHAKVAIVGYPDGHALAPGASIVGSSNITLPRDMARQNEQSDLDVLLDGERNYKQLTAWYQEHWAASQDFQKELFEELVRWPSLAAEA